MRLLLQITTRKASLVLILALVAVLIIHQISYTSDLRLSSRSFRLVDQCYSPNLIQHQSSDTIESTNIPKLIHQIWKTTDVSSYPAPASHQAWKTMFEPLNFTVKLWTDDDVLSLIKARYIWLLSTYEGYGQDIQRADMARLVVVHAEGGIYADLDVHPRSVDAIRCLQQSNMTEVFAPTAGTLSLSNHFFMASKGSHFLQWTLQEAKRRGGPVSSRILLPYLRVFWSTGPIMVTSALKQYDWMYAPAPNGVALMEERYTRLVIGHGAGRSWHGSDGQALNYFADHLLVSSFLVAAFGMGALVGTVILLKSHRNCHQSIGTFKFCT